MTNNSQDSQNFNSNPTVPGLHSIFGPRTLAAMPPLRVPPPSYGQVGPRPPAYLVNPPPQPLLAPGPPPAGSQLDHRPPRMTLPLQDAIPPPVHRAPSPPPEPESEPEHEHEHEPEPEPELQRRQVSVRLEWTPNPTSRPTGSRVGRPSTAKQSVNKLLELVVTDMTRTEFITAILGAHNLQSEYRVSTEYGPPIKMFWKGSGGERNPITIESDSDFDSALNLLRQRRSSTPVTAIFCTDDMQAWQVKKRGVPDDGFDEVGRAGPSDGVPTEANGSTELHGGIIVKLGRKWECTKHRRDHKTPGACYVTDTGLHIELTHLHFKVWSAAIAANTGATLDQPPPNDLFEDPDKPENTLDSFLPSASKRAKGRRSATNSNQGVDNTALTSSVAAGAAVAAGIFGAFGLGGGNQAMFNQQPAKAPCQNQVRTPSPIPEAGTEIEACVAAYHEKYGINLSERIVALKHRDLGPDIIHKVPFNHLADVLEVPEGGALRFQEFAQEWYNKLKARRQE